MIPDTEVRLREVDVATPDDVYWCDGLAVGSPTNMGILSWKMKRFWDEAMFNHWGKVACAFSSSGGWGGGAEIACQSLQMVLMNFGFPHPSLSVFRARTIVVESASRNSVFAPRSGCFECSGGISPVLI